MLAKDVFATLGIIFAITFLVEALVEYVFGTPFDKFPKLTPHKWLLMYVSLIVGVGVSYYYQFDMIYLLAKFLEVNLNMTWLGILFSGLVIGRGSNFLHQFVSKFFPVKE